MNPLEDLTHTRSADPRHVNAGGITWVMPPASDDEISDGLRALTRALLAAGYATSGGLLGGDDGYGAYYENDTFGLHPYCWCDQEDCPWCAACDCPDDAWTYHVDGTPVSGATFYATGGYTGPGERTVTFDEAKACRWCTPGAVTAPNFWHKPTGSWVTWYKWIGRDNTAELNGHWAAILADCLASVRAGGHASSAPLPPPFGPSRTQR